MKTLLSLVVVVLIATAAPQAQDANFAINDSSYKVTEQNTVYWQFSWKLSVKNVSQDSIVIEATIEFQDAEGFIIDEGRSRPTMMRMQDVVEITGTTLVKTANAPKITQAVSKVRQVK